MTLHVKGVSKFRWLNWLFLFVPFCLCWHLLLWNFFVPEIVGGIAANITRYNNSQLLYTGYRVYGSSEWQTKSFIYWTPDSLTDVEQHYIGYFAAFKELNANQKDKLHFSRTYSVVLKIGMQVVLANASQHDRSRLLIHGYDGDPYSIINTAPNYGTLIIFCHDIFSP